ncbi:cysteine desulfurase [Striga asiatica]|uniref:Cysteine desulfurase n=1 Tax=Striga asiatica TaxID=4170 RepID=A0A5A7P320_STRAF|nr:cysteine desulfurase [Striga asiatica]
MIEFKTGETTWRLLQDLHELGRRVILHDGIQDWGSEFGQPGAEQYPDYSAPGSRVGPETEGFLGPFEEAEADFWMGLDVVQDLVKEGGSEIGGKLEGFEKWAPQSGVSLQEDGGCLRNQLGFLDLDPPVGNGVSFGSLGGFGFNRKSNMFITGKY